MPTARLITVVSSDAMESVEGNDSLYTLISQATGKEPIILGDKPIQWIQLLHAIEQPVLKLTILIIGRLLCSALFCLVARGAGEEDGVSVTLVPNLEVGKGGSLCFLSVGSGFPVANVWNYQSVVVILIPARCQFGALFVVLRLSHHGTRQMVV
nr:putative C2H2-like zinc finger protein [Ipomoea batatas]